ncbi:hypothetical protein HHI36_015434, partial [Cryptolaemus montrouzieri]
MISEKWRETEKNLKKWKSSRSQGGQKVHKLRNTYGIVIAERSEINNVIREYYVKLYASSRDSPPTNEVPVILNVGSKEIPEIDYIEISLALNQMKNGRIPGEDRITTEMLKLVG